MGKLRGLGDRTHRQTEILYGQAKAARLWYENLRNGLLDSGFVYIR